MKTHFGEMLRLYRTVNGWTLRQLGREIGISAATLLRIERGYEMDATTYLKIQVWAKGGLAK